MNKTNNISEINKIESNYRNKYIGFKKQIS